MDLGAAHGVLICLCSAEVDGRMGLLKGGVAAVEVFPDALGVKEAGVFQVEDPLLHALEELEKGPFAGLA